MNKQDSKSKPKRIRRVIPENKTHIFGLPTEYDVMAGRGGGSNNHPGNIPYWQKILDNRDSYMQAKTNQAKNAVAQKIVDSIKSTNGRFLQKERGEKGRWFELPPEVAIAKVKQALRDKYVPVWMKYHMSATMITEDGHIFTASEISYLVELLKDP